MKYIAEDDLVEDAADKLVPTTGVKGEGRGELAPTVTVSVVGVIEEKSGGRKVK